MEERILCAAIWYKELPLERDDVLKIRGNAPYNVDKGIVLCGWRHSNCLYQMVAITGLRSATAGENVEGFLTNLNRFVDRVEGAQIALQCGQIDKLKFNSKMLFSEDLY